MTKTRSNGNDSYQYDDTYQLTGANYGTGTNASSAAWSYDASGNRTQALSTNGTNTVGISYSVNEINQYTSVGETSPSYNSRGDLTGINGWSFSYDAFGNLSSAQSGTNAAYYYARDPQGRRAIRQSGSNTILLLNAGDTMLEAYNASNNSATSYIYEPGIDRPLAQVLSSGVIRYVHQDALGSVVMLTDSNGAAYQSYSYDAWGKVTSRDASGSVIASSAISAPWLFTGRRYDRESGLYHYRARTYSAELGRFLQMDPIKFDAGDPNIFRYVGNDPVNGTDPSGLWGFFGFGGGSVEAGAGSGGGAQAASGIGYVFNGMGMSTGGFTASGAFASDQLGGKANEFAAGASGGVGAGFGITDAKCFGDLAGDFDTWTLNTPLGSLQFATGGGIWTASYSFGRSLGLSASRYNVTTTSTATFYNSGK